MNRYLSSDLLAHMTLSEFTLWCEFAFETSAESSVEPSVEGSTERTTLIDVGEMPTVRIERT